MSDMQSLVDNSKMVYPNQWVLSLVVKPKGKNPEHAIMLVEGLSEDGKKFIYRRYDFVVEKAPDHLIQKAKGLVIIKDQWHTLSEFSEEERQDYFWQSIMKDLALSEGCKGASWIITPDQAKRLHEAVLVDQKNPPDYQISGDKALLPASSSQSGHNCFTWARTRIKALQDNTDIQADDRLKATTLDYFYAAQTSRYLNPPETHDHVSPAPSCSMM